MTKATSRAQLFEMWPRPWRRAGDYVIAGDDREVCLIHCWRDAGDQWRGNHALADALVEWSNMEATDIS